MTRTDETTDRDYYGRRAREERQKAAGCAEKATALVHLTMAKEYERRADSSGGSGLIAVTG